jgi:hypothetical protein
MASFDFMACVRIMTKGHISCHRNCDIYSDWTVIIDIAMLSGITIHSCFHLLQLATEAYISLCLLNVNCELK